MSGDHLIGEAGPAEPQYAGDGSAGLPGTKPVWSLQQIVSNLTREDARWSPAPVPYTFYGATPAHLAGQSDWKGFVSFTGEQREAARLAMGLISDVAGVLFVERADDGSQPGVANPRLTFSTSLSTEQYFTAYANVDFTDGLDLGDAHRIHSSELMFNGHRWTGSMAPGFRPFSVLMHEIMHGLGVSHPGAYNRNANEEITYGKHAEYAQDSGQFTVMSYFGAEATGSNVSGWADTPLLHDVAALQSLYGANMSTRAGNTTYGYNSTAGRQAFDFTLNAAPFITIWDGGGVDTLDFSLTPHAVTLDLNDGRFSDAFQMTNNISIAFGVVIENARGGAAGDGILGNAAANVLEGLDGDDALWGADGADRLYGGNGGDTLVGQIGDDEAWGGAGRDRLYGSSGLDLMVGEAGDDELWGGEDRDLLYGWAGADVLVGEAGADELWGGDDNDFIYGNDGRDVLIGERGVDELWGGEGDDTLYGSDDGDRLIGEGGNDAEFGGAGDDLITGQAGADELIGEGGNDRLYGDGGRDLLVGYGENDELWGGADEDRLYGSEGDDVLVGEAGADELWGGSGRDRQYGADGADLLVGEDGDDELWGGADADRAYGSAGSDTLVGEGGDDQLFGGSGADALFGGAGQDLLVGESGADLLFGDAGDDRLVGGADADRFVFEAVAGRDTVLDFNRAEGDRFSLSSGWFTALTVSDADGDGRLDSTLTHADGMVVVLGVSDLTLDGWNGLVV